MVNNKKEIIIDYMINAPCNLDCPFCYGPNPKMEGSLNKKNKLKLLENFHKNGVTKIVIAGGEPTLSKDLVEVCKKGCELGLGISLQTNGFFQKKLSQVLNYIDWIAIPIDGVSNESQMLMRSSKSHLTNSELALKNVNQFNLCSQRKIHIKVGTVVSKSNLMELMEIAGLLTNYNISVWKLYKIRKRGKGQSFYNENFVEDNQVTNELSKIKSRFPTLNIHYSASEDSKDSYILVDPDSSTYIIAGKQQIKFGELFNKKGEFLEKKFIEILDLSNSDLIYQNISKSFPGWLK